MIRQLAVIAVLASAVPLAASEGDVDYAAAQTFYEAGKARSVKPQALEEFLLCAAYWDAHFKAQHGGMLTLEDDQALGEDLFEVDARAQSIAYRMMYDKQIDLEDERLWQLSWDASKERDAFFAGEQAPGERYFGMLGWCKLDEVEPIDDE